MLFLIPQSVRKILSISESTAFTSFLAFRSATAENTSAEVWLLGASYLQKSETIKGFSGVKLIENSIFSSSGVRVVANFLIFISCDLDLKKLIIEGVRINTSINPENKNEMIAVCSRS